MPDVAFPSLRAPVAWAILPRRSALLVRGADAVAFVDKFTTAALAALVPGSGCEGFFTDVRGHVLALVNVLRTDEGLWLDAPPGVADPLRAHLEHYLIRERVEFVDATASRGSLLLAGTDAAAWLAARVVGGLPTQVLGHRRIRIGDLGADVVAVDWYGPGGLLMQVSAAEVGRLVEWSRSTGLPEIDAASVAALRIAAGSPEPADFDSKTLPQELGRDARAISFTKGCYLGQETVARLDALGHVNRRLVVLATAAPPAVGAAVTAAGEPVGRVTSACAFPHVAGGLALALVHVRGLGAVGLEIEGAPARVVPTPHVALTER